MFGLVQVTTFYFLESGYLYQGVVPILCPQITTAGMIRPMRRMLVINRVHSIGPCESRFDVRSTAFHGLVDYQWHPAFTTLKCPVEPALNSSSGQKWENRYAVLTSSSVHRLPDMNQSD